LKGKTYRCLRPRSLIKVISVEGLNQDYLPEYGTMIEGQGEKPLAIRQIPLLYNTTIYFCIKRKYEYLNAI